MHQSIERRLVADVPVGVLLSGGLDSTIIASVMASLTQGPVQTFAASFEDSPNYNEAAFARLVSQRLGTTHHEVHVGPDCIAQLDMLVEAHDGPFGDSSALPVHAVTKIAKENVTVALSGEGAVGGGDGKRCVFITPTQPELPESEKTNSPFLRGRPSSGSRTVAPMGRVLRGGSGSSHETRRPPVVGHGE